VQRVLRLEGFLAETRGHAVTVDPLRDDPATAGAGLDAADLDLDGRVAGEEELTRLFALLDRMDGRRDRRLRTGGLAAPALDAIGRAMDIPSFRVQPDAVRGAVVVLGMSDSATAEASALRRDAPVLLVTDVPGRRDTIGGHDLGTDRGRRAFVATLALGPEVTARLLDVLAEAPAGGRRELAGLARLWAPAERGLPVPARLVVSGHGDGTRFFGADHDELRDTDLLALARAMPRAAAAIEHLHLAACQHGYEPRIAPFLEAFPRLASVWGYTGFSPSGAAAHRHQRTWERATRDLPSDGAPLRRELARGSHRGNAVAVWTRARGYEGLPIRELRLIHADLVATRAEYARFFRGEEEPASPMHGPLAERYQRVQELVAHGDFREQSDAFRDRWERERDAVLRLRYFRSHVGAAFERHYRSQIEAGYRALGLPPPRFAGLGRREALAEVERFERAAAGLERVPAAALVLHRLLDEGLRGLSSEIIPTRWL
jgi:hypothetical protein